MRCPKCNHEFDPGEVSVNSRATEIHQIFAFYRSMHPRAHLQPHSGLKEWRLISDRLREGFTAADLMAAIEGMHRTPFNMGMNDRNQKYLGLELCMRTGSQVTRFIEQTREQTPLTKANQQTAETLRQMEVERAWNGNLEAAYGKQHLLMGHFNKDGSPK